MLASTTFFFRGTVECRGCHVYRRSMVWSCGLVEDLAMFCDCRKGGVYGSRRKKHVVSDRTVWVPTRQCGLSPFFSPSPLIAPLSSYNLAYFLTDFPVACHVIAASQDPRRCRKPRTPSPFHSLATLLLT